MSQKTLYYVQLAEDTARRLTGSWERWADFLSLVGRLYKYPYHDQLMIYAQRPNATACASYDVWNDRMNRYVRRGSKGRTMRATSCACGMCSTWLIPAREQTPATPGCGRWRTGMESR